MIPVASFKQFSTTRLSIALLSHHNYYTFKDFQQLGWSWSTTWESAIVSPKLSPFSLWMKDALYPNPLKPLPAAGALQAFFSNNKFGTENPRPETLKAVSCGFTLKQRMHN